MDSISPDIPRKQCSMCLQEKPNTTDFFYHHRKQCKECLSKKGKEYYASHKEQHQVFMHTYHLTHKDEYRERDKKYREKNLEKRAGYVRAYRMRHRERLLARERAKRLANPGKQRQYTQSYHQRHPGRSKEISYRYRLKHRDRINVHKRNYYARKQQAQDRHTAQDIQDQYERQKGKCYYCHRKLGKEKHQYHVDHVIPLSKGGSNGPDNLVIACPSCNSSKHNSLPHEWPKGGRLL